MVGPGWQACGLTQPTPAARADRTGKAAVFTREEETMTAYVAAPSGAHGLIPVAVVVSLITAGGTFIVGWLNLRGQKETFKWQRDHATKQIDLMQSGQITYRFMRAIEHLGSSSSQVRIGGIFALERIARESPPDRPHIVSTLAALVRERLPALAVGDGGYVQVLMQRAPDAQAAMTALCRPPLSDDRRDSSEIGGLDLSRTDLRRASLKNADLRGANLWGAHLENADLRRADLTHSNLNNAHFGTITPGQPGFERGTDLRHATLTRAQLNNTYDFSAALTEGVIGLADDERTQAGRQA